MKSLGVKSQFKGCRSTEMKGLELVAERQGLVTSNIFFTFNNE